MQDNRHEMILVLDFGGQYSQLIARRIREAKVYCEIHPYNITLEKLKELAPKGIILSGGGASVYEKDAPHCSEELFTLGIPVLGICYGMQLITHVLGGKVTPSPAPEYGSTDITLTEEHLIFDKINKNLKVWMSHGDMVEKAPEGFTVAANTKNAPVASIVNVEKNIYGLQFHPEVVHTQQGIDIINNFIFKVCKCSGDWTTESFIEKTLEQIKATVGDKKVLCALSGGVDSSVAARLVHEAIGSQLTCVYVNHGFMRKGESEQVVRVFRDELKMNLVYVDASERFLGKLKGVTEPETKRKIIGEEFIRVFEAEAKKIEGVEFLVQGTVYPDVIESGTATAAVIKSHHNVGGLPEDMDFKLIEPLRELFKDEVRLIGKELGLSEQITLRQPFPGPGLAIRIIGEITVERLDILRNADEIVYEEIKAAGLYTKVWQSFAILPAMRSVGVMGDNRTYDYTVGLRIVQSDDGMTADWVRLPYEVLDSISRRIVNEVKGVNRIVYDITSKPPSTIEWE